MDTWIVQKRSVEPCRDKQDTLDWIKAVFDFSGLTVGVVLSIWLNCIFWVKDILAEQKIYCGIGRLVRRFPWWKIETKTLDDIKLLSDSMWIPRARHPQNRTAMPLSWYSTACSTKSLATTGRTQGWRTWSGYWMRRAIIRSSRRLSGRRRVRHGWRNGINLESSGEKWRRRLRLWGACPSRRLSIGQRLPPPPIMKSP